MIPSEARKPINSSRKWVGVQTIVANSFPFKTMVNGNSIATVSCSIDECSPSKRIVSHPSLTVLFIVIHPLIFNLAPFLVPQPAFQHISYPYVHNMFQLSQR